jgi:NDP-sugar pyrophosphorylase family protein
MLNGLSLKENIFSVLNKNPFVVPEGLNADAIRQIMISNRIFQVPEVDKDYRILNLHCIDHLFEQKKLENKFVIMAGGRGSRLKPLTDKCPKPMLEVKGKPILLRIIEQAKSEGFSDFTISTNYLSHIIEDYFRDGSEFGVKIDYITESKPLGTAGSLAYLNKKTSHPIVVTNGDVICDVKYSDILDFHLKHGAGATMAVRLQERQNPYGVVKMEGVKIIGFEEKPCEKFHVNAGIYVISSESLQFLNVDAFTDMPDFFDTLNTRNFTNFAYPMHEPWLDVGNPVDFQQANNNQ